MNLNNYENNLNNDKEEKFDVTISTVNFNVTDQLQKCIDSVVKYCKDVNYEWFIIDNNSEDDDFDKVIKKYSKFKRLKFIKNKRNEGGLVENRLLNRINSRYFLFLQPDVILKNNAIGLLIDFMDSHDNAGAASAKFLNPDGSFQFYLCRLPNLSMDFFKHTGLGRYIDQSLLLNRKHVFYDYIDINLNKISEIEHIGLVCYILRTKLIREDGYIHDPDFIFFYGDYDLNKRIKDKGYKLYFVPDAEVFHYISSSLKKHPDQNWVKVQAQRARIKYYRKNNMKKLWILKVIIIFEYLASLFSILPKTIKINDFIQTLSRIIRY